MQLRNDTPFSPMYFKSLDEADRPVHVAVLRGTFDVRHDAALRPGAEQAPVVMADEYHGGPLASSVRMDADLVPKKYHADVTLHATAHAPGGRPADAWEVGVAVGKLVKKLRVTGPRQWKRALGGWSLTKPEPCTRVPLRYEYAYGGAYRADGGADVRYEPNPVGRGFVDARKLRPADTVPAPQVEDPGEPVAELGKAYRPAGFAPVAKHCLPRRALCGTADEKWKAERWPLRPRDFDFHYYNSAPDGLRCDGHLAGDELVWLRGLAPGGDVRFHLPGLKLLAFTLDGAGRVGLDRLLLDTLHIDLEKRQAFLTWRATLPARGPLTALQFVPENGRV